MSSVMFNIVGALFAIGLVLGGGLSNSTDHQVAVVGFVIIAVASVGLGFMMSFALHVGAGTTPHEEFRAEGGSALTYHDLHAWVMGRDESACWDPPIYINDTVIVPADGVFIAWINGRRALVIDRATPLAAETTTVLKPTFSDREVQ